MPQSRKILVVDDDAEILSSLRTVLEHKGYTVTTASDGEEGIEAAVREQPDLVIVDMMMPKKSGFLVTEKLKSAGATAPKLVMITANEGSRHRAYAEMLGVDDYLRKPFALEKLVEIVTGLCPLTDE